MDNDTVLEQDTPFAMTDPRRQSRNASQCWNWISKGASALTDQGMVSGSSFALNIFLARWLGREQFGAYALSFSIFLFLSSFHNALLLEPMSVFGAGDFRKSLPQYLGQLVRLHFIVTGVIAGLMCITTMAFGLFSRSPLLVPSFWGVGVSFPFILFFWLWRRAAYLEAKPSVAIRGAVVYASTTVGLLYLFERLQWLSSFTAFAIQGIAGVAAGLLLIQNIQPRLTSVDHSLSSIFKQHWRYGRWVAVSAFVFWLNGGAYYVIVGSMLRMQDVAGLRAIQTLVLPVTQFLTATSLLLLPRASSLFSDHDRIGFRRNIKRITFLFIGTAGAYGVAIVLFGNRVIAVVYGGRYTEYSYLLPWLALGILLTAAAQGPMIAMQAVRSPSEIFMGYAIGAATILPGIALIRYYGVLGAALGLALSSLAFLMYVGYRCNLVLKERPLLAASETL
jgi:O-antigen/teichoic acid export membrane protein